MQLYKYCLGISLCYVLCYGTPDRIKRCRTATILHSGAILVLFTFSVLTLCSMAKAHPRNVAYILMRQKPDIYKDVRTVNGFVRKNVLHCVFECPRKEECKNGPAIASEKGSGYSVRFRHLRSCLSNGNEADLYTKLEAARDRNNVFCRPDAPKPTQAPSLKELAMFGYL